MFFAKPTPDQALALAGVCQACQLVDALATSGLCQQRDFDTCINSLFERNADSALAVFGSVDALHTGLDTLQRVLGSTKSGEHANLLRYILGVLHLQRRLNKDRTKLNAIADGIDKARRQAEHFSRSHANVVANLADTYLNTISHYNFRIQVKGMPQHLQQPDIANKIRCLLFAAIRAAMLWHQLGGRRLQFIVQRPRVLAVAGDLRRMPYEV